jgi:prepilin-type N-terminal cleavage/methylation domain-containing protein
MKSVFRQSRSGFTLIELMVVLMIIGLSVALVSPRVLDLYDKVMLHAEEQKLRECFAVVKNRAFIRQVSLTMAFKEKAVTIQGESSPVRFDIMTFAPVVVTFNGNGFSDTEKISYQALGAEKLIDVSE